MEPAICNRCKKLSKLIVPARPFSSPICINCRLQCNKALLLKCFNEVVKQPSTQEFDEEMNEWYPHEV